MTGGINNGRQNSADKKTGAAWNLCFRRNRAVWGRRIGQTMERLRMQSMKKFLPQLQNTFARKNTAQAKNVLALMTQRRVQIIRILTEA